MFLVGLEDGIFPHSRSLNDRKELEEERRLAYVAITRAEKILYVTHSMRRRVYGEEIAAEPSQFLNEMPLELIEDLSHGPSWLSFARSSTPSKAATRSRHFAARRRSEKPKNLYTGKTYNNADAIAEFFKKRYTAIRQRAAKTGRGSGAAKTASGYEKFRSLASDNKHAANRARRRKSDSRGLAC